MTPEQLMVERDRLLEGGRTLEEVARMQAAAEHFVEARESWDLQNLAMHNAEIVPVILENTWGRIAGALGRELLRSGVAEMRQRRDGDQLTMTLRLWGGSGRRD